MNSINQNQPEDNYEDLHGGKAIDKLKDLAKDETCFFTTQEVISKTGGTRPMSVREVTDGGEIWFLGASDSHTVAAVESNPAVKLYFKGASHAEFLVLDGNASTTRDKETIDRLWDPHLKTWFTEGKNDPRIVAIKVSPTDGYYWDNKHGSMVAGVKMMIGAAIGKTLDDSIEGKIAP